MNGRLLAVLALAAGFAGCSSYSWRSAVPEEMRTVSVPMFRNDSDVVELGAAMTRQVLREFEREGTFGIRRSGDAAVEVQGVVVRGGSGSVDDVRSYGRRVREYRLSAVVEVSFIDKRSGKVLVDGRRYHAATTFAAGDDRLTGERDASGRLAEDLARQVVDDLVAWKWQER